MKTTIQVSGLSKSYGALHVIKSLDLTVSKGEVYGLLGANGAGKSTAIECMLGTKKADTGSISILGMSPQKDRRSLFQQVGVQFQEANYPDKIRVSELCEETACLYNGPADYTKLLKQFGLQEKAKNFVSELSGGQKAKVLLLKMSLGNANVLILDEPTRNFSPLSGPVIRKMLREFPGAIISISHDRKYIGEVCGKEYLLEKDGLRLIREEK